MTQNAKFQLGERQKASLTTLRRKFGLSDAELNRCLFFYHDQDEPWIPPDILEAIARQNGGFRQVTAIHDKYVAERQQVLYIATVVDELNRTFTRSGAAIIGEKSNDVEIDVDILAAGRALNAALTAAGFNPFKAGSVVDLAAQEYSGQPLNDREQELQRITDESTLRTKDLKQIHAIADRKGLILGGDMAKYRKWLRENFGVISAGVLDASTRTAVVNKLNEYRPENDWLSEIPIELREDALIA